MNNQEILHKEVDLIQGVINRMAANSFLLKGWIISLIAVIIALTKDTIVATDVSYFSLVLLFPVIVFWYLDAFFLHKERCYIQLYNWVIQNRPSSTEKLYSLNYKDYESKVDSVFKIMFSKKLRLFYGFIFAFLISIAIYNYL